MTLTHNTYLPRDSATYGGLERLKYWTAATLLEFTDKRWARCRATFPYSLFPSRSFEILFRQGYRECCVEKRGWVHGISISFVKYNREIRRESLETTKRCFLEKKGKKERKFHQKFSPCSIISMQAPMIELKKKKRRNFSFTTVISSRESYEWSLGVSFSFFFFIYKDIIFTIILQFSRDQEWRLSSSRVTVGAPCGTRGSLIADITVSSPRTLGGFRDRNDSSRTRCCSLSWHDDSTNGRDTLLFFSPLFFFFLSTLPFRVSFLLSSLSFLFSSLSFFFYPPREYFHHSGGVQCWGCTQWELNSTSFSLPSTKIRRDSRRYRAHNGEGICNNEATMNRNAPRCPIARFCGNPIYLHFPFTNCTPLTPGGWLVARRFSSPLDRDKNL